MGWYTFVTGAMKSTIAVHTTTTPLVVWQEDGKCIDDSPNGVPQSQLTLMMTESEIPEKRESAFQSISIQAKFGETPWMVSNDANDARKKGPKELVSGLHFGWNSLFTGSILVIYEKM